MIRNLFRKVQEPKKERPRARFRLSINPEYAEFKAINIDAEIILDNLKYKGNYAQGQGIKGENLSFFLEVRAGSSIHDRSLLIPQNK